MPNREVVECGDCRRRLPDGTCGLTEAVVDDDDFCSKGTTNTVICEICQRPILMHLTFMQDVDGQFHTVCRNCGTMLNISCIGCERMMEDCAFISDNTLPKMVVKQVQRGNIVMQAQVMNPELIEKTCKKCVCFEGGRCRRQLDCGCKKVKRKWEAMRYDALSETNS